MKYLLHGCASALIGLSALTAQAQVPDEVIEQIQKSVRGITPDASQIIANETPIPGVLEVRIDSELFYMSENGRYLIQGRVVDLEEGVDLTEAAQNRIRRERYNEIDPAELISFGPEDADHELLVFTDVDCGYCRRLHEQIDEYNEEGIRVSYLAFPRAGAGSVTHEKMVSVWCADDAQAAMTLAKAGQTPPKATCNHPVDYHTLLGKEMGVSGTPALMTPDGKLIPGYVPPKQLRARLDQAGAE
jgi:thiol:disulfide interchange protein DsbC